MTPSPNGSSRPANTGRVTRSRSRAQTPKTETADNATMNTGDSTGYSTGETNVQHRSIAPAQSQDDLEDKGKDACAGEVASAIAHSTIPAWLNMTIMISLIFGGCCSNVFALEAIIKEDPGSGPLITLVQFVIVALFTLPHFLSASAGVGSFFISRRAIPLASWVVYTAFFLTVNLLNNIAFAYRISVPLHIILRSGGPVASMIIGYLYNAKRYTRGQVLAVVLLTIGVVGAALADAEAQGKSIHIGLSSTDQSGSLTTFLTGFTILALAMVLSAFQGVYADRLYEQHGRDHWREALFYSHTLSLPFFMSSYPQLSAQWNALVSSPPLAAALARVLGEDSTLLLSNTTSTVEPLSTGAPVLASSTKSALSALLLSLQDVPVLRPVFTHVPIKVVYLVLNGLTQYFCIRGVHLLSAKSSSLTVTIVLNIRKLVSLLLSIYLFGNDLATGVLAGAAVVFLGGGLYGFEGARLRKRKEKSG